MNLANRCRPTPYNVNYTDARIRIVSQTFEEVFGARDMRYSDRMDLTSSAKISAPFDFTFLHS
jgi:hypothetical protein